MVLSRAIILVTVTLFILASIIPSINLNAENNSSDLETNAINSINHIDFESVDYTENTDWWTMFHHDSMHNGYSSDDAPDSSVLKWSYSAGLDIKSSPAVVDGKVFVASDDYNIYCFRIDRYYDCPDAYNQH